MMQVPVTEIDVGEIAGPWAFMIVTLVSIAVLLLITLYIAQTYRKTRAKLLLVLMLWSAAFLVHEALEILNYFVGMQTITGKLRIFNNLAELFTVMLIFYLISR